MSLSSATQSVAYSGNNSTVTAYTIPFKFFNDSDIYAKVTDASGNITVLALTTNFTLTGEGDDSGGEMLTVSAWANTYTVTIERRPPYTQLKAFREGQASAMEAMEAGLDVLVMQIQRLAALASTLDTEKPGLIIAAAAPTVDDDIDKGYVIGHLWLDTTNSVVYGMTDNTDGAAVWFVIGASSDIFDTAASYSTAQVNQALTNLQLFDSGDTIVNGAKFERNPDGGLDLALFDQGTNTFRKVRLNNGSLIVE